MRLRAAHLMLMFVMLNGHEGYSAQSDDVGSGSSGGGILVRDLHNPWWVQNTSTVKYCVSIDEGRFLLDRETAEQRIAEAFAYWKMEFSKAMAPHNGELESPNDQILVATQSFIKTDCGPDVDLTFQLGFATDKQTQQLDESDSIIALAVRREYDRENLRARGYIYVSPDYGPAMPRNLGHQSTWQAGDGALFKATIVHELGHVFGLTHSGSAHSLMSENVIEELVSGDALSREMKAALINEFGPGDVFKATAQPGFGICVTGGKPGQWDLQKERALGIDAARHPCQKFSYVNGFFKVYAGQNSQDMKLIGQAEMKTIKSDSRHDLVRMWLPPEQKVFKLKSKEKTRRFTAARVVSLELKGIYKNQETGRSAEIAFELTPGQAWPPRVSAVVDGRLISNLLIVGE